MTLSSKPFNMMFCVCGKISENLETGECATCGHFRRKEEKKAADLEEKKKKAKQIKRKTHIIKQISVKQARAISEYSRLKGPWIQGKRCAVYPGQKAIQIHHMKGKIGYADQWARDNDIPLLIDKRYWLPVSMDGHVWIETHRAEAEENGWTLTRAEYNDR